MPDRHCCRLAQISADVVERRGVHDGGPARALPDAAGDVDRAEPFRHDHEVDRRTEHHVDRAGHRQQDAHDTAQNDDGDEVGQIQHKLNLPLFLCPGRGTGAGSLDRSVR